jgi:tetratricopeptide (TPR) repeat protein
LEENDIALALFDKVIEINPENIYGYFNRGILNYKMNELDNAEDDFTTVIELFPDFIDAWVNRSVIRHEKGDNEGAEHDRQKFNEIMDLVSMKESNVDSLYNIYKNKIDYDKIIAFDSEFSNGDKGGKLAQYASIDIRPFNNFIVSTVLFDSKKVEQNKRNYVDATLSQINESKQLKGIQLVYTRIELFEENYQSILNDSVIESIDDNDLRTFLKGIANYEIFNYQHAENIFKSLSGNQIYDTYTNINIASIQKDKAELIISNQTYNDPIMINYKKTPDKKTIKKQAKPDYSESLNSLTTALKNNEHNPFIWYNMGNLHLQMQEFHKAIDDYSQAISYEETLAEAYYNRGLTLLYLGEKELAISDLSKAGELGIKEAYAVIKRFF